MKKLLLAFYCCFLGGFAANAQQFCNPNGNLIVFSNYDGGNLTINVDVNIPNLKIGVVSYEACNIVVTGAFAANVTDVAWAGFNATNNHCGFGGSTTITSGSSTNVTATMPPVTLANPNGSNSIIYSYACDNTGSNPGGNTPDQIEHYFTTMFPGSTVRFHKSQYGCFGTELVSAGGNCCGSPVTLSVGITSANPACADACTGTATAAGSNGTAPYDYQWTGGPATAQWTGLCAGTYTVTVTDDLGATATNTVTITEPAVITNTISHTACMSYVFNGNTITQSGTYLDTLVASNGCDSFLTLNLTVGTGVNLNVTQTTTTLTSAQAGATYQWLSCPANTIVAGATAQAYSPTTSGQYSVVVSYQGCSDTSACYNLLPVNVAHVAANTEFNVYPNPAHNEVYIESAITDGAYVITDQLGKVVLNGNINSTKTAISLRELSAGLYFLNINEAQPIKLIKQ